MAALDNITATLYWLELPIESNNHVIDALGRGGGIVMMDLFPSHPSIHARKEKAEGGFLNHHVQDDNAHPHQMIGNRVE